MQYYNPDNNSSRRWAWLAAGLYGALLAAAFLAGLSLLLYPTVSDYWNSLHASKAVAAYDQEVRQLDQGRYDALLDAAREYNRTLLDRSSGYYLTDDQKARYDSLLNVDGGGIMGYIEIPTIKLSLPIYHGTEEDVLQIAVGHLDWSSLPVGGESTHCVLSGHRGPAGGGGRLRHPHPGRGPDL